MPDGLSDREHIKRTYQEGPSGLLLDLAERITRLEGASVGSSDKQLEILREIMDMRKELREANITMLQRDIGSQGKDISELRAQVATHTLLIGQAKTGLRIGVDAGKAVWAFFAAAGGAALSWFLSRGK